MGLESLKRYLINNKTLVWRFLRNNKDFTICQVPGDALFLGCIVKNHGENNRIVIEPGASVRHCTFCMEGDNNLVYLGRNVKISGCTFYASGAGNEINLGEGTTVTGRTEFIAVEGTKVSLGCDCMLAYGIVIRSGDHHPIYDASGKRLNLAQSVAIGDHVWIGQNACILKGVTLECGCIVGACAVVTKSCMEENTALAGNPAKPIKTGVRWER